MLGIMLGIFIPLFYVCMIAIVGKHCYRTYKWESFNSKTENAVFATLFGLVWPAIAPAFLLRSFYDAPTLAERADKRRSARIKDKKAQEDKLTQEIRKAEGRLADVNAELRRMGIDS